MPPIIRKNITALGLKKRNHIVYQAVSVATAHRLATVKELVKIELVSERKDERELSLERKFALGFETIKGEMLNQKYETK